jgi:hypothetical protein
MNSSGSEHSVSGVWQLDVCLELSMQAATMGLSAQVKPAPSQHTQRRTCHEEELLKGLQQRIFVLRTSQRKLQVSLMGRPPSSLQVLRPGRSEVAPACAGVVGFRTSRQARGFLGTGHRKWMATVRGREGFRKAQGDRRRAIKISGFRFVPFECIAFTQHAVACPSPKA